MLFSLLSSVFYSLFSLVCHVYPIVYTFSCLNGDKAHTNQHAQALQIHALFIWSIYGLFYVLEYFPILSCFIDSPVFYPLIKLGIFVALARQQPGREDAGQGEMDTDKIRTFYLSHPNPILRYCVRTLFSPSSRVLAHIAMARALVEYPWHAYRPLVMQMSQQGYAAGLEYAKKALFFVLCKGQSFLDDKRSGSAPQQGGGAKEQQINQDKQDKESAGESMVSFVTERMSSIRHRHISSRVDPSAALATPLAERTASRNNGELIKSGNKENNNDNNSIINNNKDKENAATNGVGVPYSPRLTRSGRKLVLTESQERFNIGRTM